LKTIVYQRRDGGKEGPQKTYPALRRGKKELALEEATAPKLSKNLS
jgi:hypothetical protein